MPPPLAPAERPEPPVTQNSASHESSNRISDADADATGQLDILDAEDILESDEISALEAAAEGIVCFEVDQAPIGKGRRRLNSCARWSLKVRSEATNSSSR